MEFFEIHANEWMMKCFEIYVGGWIIKDEVLRDLCRWMNDKRWSISRYMQVDDDRGCNALRYVRVDNDRWYNTLRSV